MPRTEARERTYMMNIDLSGVSRHCLGHSENIGSARAQEKIPKPEIGHQFRVGPGETTHVVTPGVPYAIVRVHEVAVIPKTEPLTLFGFLLIKGHGLIELLLKSRFGWRAAIRQTPQPKCAKIVIVTRSAH